MSPVDYVVALLDADPHGWVEEGSYLTHKEAQINIRRFDPLNWDINGKITCSLGPFDTHRVRRAVKRRQSAILSQSLLEIVEKL